MIDEKQNSINLDSFSQPTVLSGDSSVVPTTVQPTVDFGPEANPAAICSGNTCSAGHIWPPVIAVAKCPGCGAPILVVKMVNCPVCNEPPSKLRLRTDHLPQNGAIMPMCRGSASLGDVGVIEINRVHAKHEQENYTEREMVGKL